FYGAMDGASKFVRGDAVAGLLITVINVVGGFTIGVLQKGMTLAEALGTYTILTIGDGLVAQIPALILSTAAGIIVTRAAAETNLGEDIARQLTSYPRAILIAASMLFIFGLIPGLPTVPFLLLSLIAGSLGYFIYQAQKEKVDREKVVAKEKEEKKPEERVEDYLAVDRMEIEIGYGLIPLVDVRQGGDLLERVTMIRKQMALDMGIIVPPIRIRDNIQLRPNDYQIKLRGNPIASGTLQASGYLAMNPGYVEEEIEGVETTEPAFGLPAKWIAEAVRDRAETLGYTVVEPAAVLATHLTETVKAYAYEIMNRQDVQRLIDNIRRENASLVDELLPSMISVGGVQKVLQRLLRERVPVRDLTTILESLAEHVPVAKDPDILTEYVRAALARTICQIYRTAENTIPVIILDHRLEGTIADATQTTVTGIRVAIPPDTARRVFSYLTELVGTMTSAGQHPIVLTAPSIRFAFRRLTEASFPSLTVLSYNEILPGIDVYTVGVLSLEEESEAAVAHV
ncbi:MAG: FHIPEP family type III secretion protein, partial [Candidatus Latescibacteria bacterium]|nr:FHIPEP family type III secretion protein [Candidatus Latescibacterota bacterium]